MWNADSRVYGNTKSLEHVVWSGIYFQASYVYQSMLLKKGIHWVSRNIATILVLLPTPSHKNGKSRYVLI